jgi:hypothetical protein
MLFTLLTLPPAVMADRMYHLQSGPSLPMGWTLSGTITTDGTIGTIQATNILSWTWTISSGGSSVTVSSTDPGAAVTISGMDRPTAAEAPLGITSTGAALIVPFANYITLTKHDAWLWYDNNIDQQHWQVTLPGVRSGVADVWVSTGNWSQPDGPIEVASTVVVPEPSPLYIVGFGAVCVYVMGHKRRARRTATTDA